MSDKETSDGRSDRSKPSATTASSERTPPRSGPGGVPENQKWIWPFELIERIGEGGMGVVYRARYVPKGIEVALKMLPDDLSSPTLLARFERELEVLKNLRHPHIVHCFGGSCENDRRFYAMELLGGGTLDDVLRERGKLPWEQVVEYGVQMCRALQYLHEHGVVHRDIKPGNFLLDGDGRLKLSDFGIATMAAARRITDAGKTLGTYHYMAPEQVRGQTVTPRTDLYALGCVLFELLVGRPPFRGNSAAEILQKHTSEQPPAITQFALDTPETLERIVQRLLAKDPTDRYVDADDVRKQLAAVTQTVQVLTRAPEERLREAAAKRRAAKATQKAVPTAPAVSDASEDSRSVPLIAGLVLLCTILACTHVWFWWLGDEGSSGAAYSSWVEAVSHHNPEVRLHALNVLTDLAPSDEDAAALVADRLDAPDHIERQAALSALAAMGPSAKSELPAVLRIAKVDESPRVRYAAEQAATAIRQPARSFPIGWLLLILAVAVIAWGGRQVQRQLQSA